jgi:uncharacterized protein YukE
MIASQKFLIAAAIAATMAVSMPCVAMAAGGGAKTSASQRALEVRLEMLEKQNQMLEQQNRTIQSQLSNQKAEIDVLKQQIQGTAQPVANLQQDVPKLKQQVADIEKKQSVLPFEVGFRTGWAESPYKMPGGFFYGAYLNHLLLTHDDGIPGGFVSGELMAGVVMGNHANTTANLASQLVPALGSQSTWLDTVEIEPTVQYHLDPGSLGYEKFSWIKPYVLAGPAMYISLMSTPVVAKGKIAGDNYRHYDADFQGGGVFGLGTELSLSQIKAPAIQGILDKSIVGAEWRYNQFGNGEGFNQYSGSIGFGW